MKWAASLADKKGRAEAKSFIAEGEKLTFEALRRGLPVTHVFILEGKEERLLPLVKSYDADGQYEDCQIILLYLV